MVRYDIKLYIALERVEGVFIYELKSQMFTLKTTTTLKLNINRLSINMFVY